MKNNCQLTLYIRLGGKKDINSARYDTDTKMIYMKEYRASNKLGTRIERHLGQYEIITTSTIFREK